MNCHDINDVVAVLKQITFKKSCVNFDWTPHVEQVYKRDKPHYPGHDPDYDIAGWLVNTTFSRPDINTGNVGKGPSRQMFVPYGISETGLFFSYWIAVEKTTIHELMEAIQYKGVSVINPHHTLEELSLPQKLAELADAAGRDVSPAEAIQIIKGEALPAIENHLPTQDAVNEAKQPEFGETRGKDRDVHTEHCCVQHGCKYGKEDCTVMTGKKVQSRLCELCENAGLKFRSKPKS